jgi:hypothetical protein
MRYCVSTWSASVLGCNVTGACAGALAAAGGVGEGVCASVFSALVAGAAAAGGALPKGTLGVGLELLRVVGSGTVAAWATCAACAALGAGVGCVGFGSGCGGCGGIAAGVAAGVAGGFTRGSATGGGAASTSLVGSTVRVTNASALLVVIAGTR